ncbi:hypothetical protein [Flavobacterium sp. GCM10027622]|uniref:hypothetical protein n=1 Tax=unclassified Flavobacterium TaxID=196869 RepID=UPI00360B2DF7
MNTHRTETITVKLPNGSNVGSVTQALPKGFVLGVNVFIQTPGQNDLFLNAAIKNDAGGSPNKPTDIRFFKPRQGGSFDQSYVPIKQETQGQTFIFEVTTATGSALPINDTYIQFVLIYEQKDDHTCLNK